MNIKQLFQVSIIFAVFLTLILHNMKTEVTETVEIIEGENHLSKIDRLDNEKAQYRSVLAEKQIKIDELKKEIKKIKNEQIGVSKKVDKTSRKRKFANENRRYALASELNWGIPYTISLGQAILESNAGESYLATEANNFFGIKCGQKYCRHEKTCVLIETKEEVNGKMITKKARFRRYKSAAEGFDEHGRFLNGNRYSKIHRNLKTDYVHWAIAIKTAGYATDSKYPNKLINVIEKYVN